MMVIANAFPKLKTVKIFVRPLSKKCPFRTLSESQHVKVSQILAKSPWERFYHVFLSFSGNLIWNMSPLVLREVLWVFPNTLTANGKYPFQDCQNLPLPIQMLLSGNEKFFQYFLFDFRNLHQILYISKKRMIVTANVFPKSMTVKNLVRTLSIEHRFRGRFDSEMWKRPKYLGNLHESAFVKILRIFHSQFERNYLENEKLCLDFLFNFWNLHQLLNVLKKRMIVIPNVFP